VGCNLIDVYVAWESGYSTELPSQELDALADFNRFDPWFDLAPDLFADLGGDLTCPDILFLCLQLGSLLVEVGGEKGLPCALLDDEHRLRA